MCIYVCVCVCVCISMYVCVFVCSPTSGLTSFYFPAVIVLFCRQYDIIKDNDSSSSKDKPKRPSAQTAPSYYNEGVASSQSTPLYHNGGVQSGKVPKSPNQHTHVHIHTHMHIHTSRQAQRQTHINVQTHTPFSQPDYIPVCRLT